MTWTRLCCRVCVRSSLSRDFYHALVSNGFGPYTYANDHRVYTAPTMSVYIYMDKHHPQLKKNVHERVDPTYDVCVIKGERRKRRGNCIQFVKIISLIGVWRNEKCCMWLNIKSYTNIYILQCKESWFYWKKKKFLLLLSISNSILFTNILSVFIISASLIDKSLQIIISSL